MKLRKTLPQPPALPDSGEVQAARAMAAAIAQGLPGEQFCRLMNTMNGEVIQAAAGMNTQQLMDWFMQDEAARNILRGVPGFPAFCTAFHGCARQLYPNAPPFQFPQPPQPGEQR